MRKDISLEKILNKEDSNTFIENSIVVDRKKVRISNLNPKRGFLYVGKDKDNNYFVVEGNIDHTKGGKKGKMLRGYLGAIDDFKKVRKVDFWSPKFFNAFRGRIQRDRNVINFYVSENMDESVKKLYYGSPKNY